MHKIMRYLSWALILGLAALLFAACGPSGPPTIGEVVTAKGVDDNYKPVNPTTTFSATDTFYTSVRVENLVAGSVVLAKYIYGSQSEDLTMTADKAGSGYYAFSLDPQSEDGFPPGDYAVEVYLDGTLAKTVNFKVESSGPPSIAEAVTAKSVDANYKAVDPTSIYSPTDTFYVSVHVKNLVIGSKVTVKYSYNGTEAQENSLTADKPGSGYYSFSLSPSADGFPEGDYTADVYLDDSLAQSVTFSVVK
jgi:hypothetical protein